MFSTTKSALTTPKSLKKAAVLLGFGLALTGCISPEAGSDGRYTTPIGTAPVINNETPYSNALRCIGGGLSQNMTAPRIAVGNIRDYTGKVETRGGAQLTQGAALMAISGLSKAGVKLVERFDTAVTELELKYANDRLIGDEDANDYRRIHAGSIRGSDYYLVGGITELNYDIRRGGITGAFSDLDPTGLTASFTGRLFVMNVGLDLRLVDSRSLEVVHVVSYQKQIIGREVSAGFFDFLNGNTFEVGAGEQANEPLQLGVRSVIERAILEMIVPLYGISPAQCRSFGASGDPLGEIEYRTSTPRTHHVQEAAVRQAPVATPAPVTAPATAPAVTVRANPNAPIVAAAQPVAPAAATAPVMNDPYGYYSEPIFSESFRGRYN